MFLPTGYTINKDTLEKMEISLLWYLEELYSSCSDTENVNKYFCRTLLLIPLPT